MKLVRIQIMNVIQTTTDVQITMKTVMEFLITKTFVLTFHEKHEIKPVQIQTTKATQTIMDVLMTMKTVMVYKIQ